MVSGRLRSGVSLDDRHRTATKARSTTGGQRNSATAPFGRCGAVVERCASPSADPTQDHECLSRVRRRTGRAARPGFRRPASRRLDTASGNPLNRRRPDPWVGRRPPSYSAAMSSIAPTKVFLVAAPRITTAIRPSRSNTAVEGVIDILPCMSSAVPPDLS